MDVQVKEQETPRKKRSSSEEEEFEPLITAGAQAEFEGKLKDDTAANEGEEAYESVGEEDDDVAFIGAKDDDDDVDLKGSDKRSRKKPRGFIKRRHARKPLTTTPEDDDPDMR